MTQRQYKVLLADDVRLDLEIEKTFFQRSGFQVLTAADGLKALVMAVTEIPDLVILDQFMPGMSGNEVCKQMKAREKTRHIPVIITSAKEGPEVDLACKTAGAVAFIPKSAGQEALVHEAARILKVPERKSTRLTVCFTAQGVAGAKESLGKGVEISESGMRLETTRRYNTGDSLLLRFHIPGDREEFQAMARVIEAKQRPDGSFALGLEFRALTGKDRSRLNRHIDVISTAR